MPSSRFRPFLPPERIERHEGVGEWPQPGLAELAQRLAASRPEAEILVDGDVRLTAAELLRRAVAVGGGLSDRGLGPGDVVSWELPSWWESAVLAIAIDWIGGVSNPIIPIYREREVGFVARQAGTRALFVPAEFRGFDYRDLARTVRDECRSLEHVFVVRGEPGDGMTAFEELLAGARQPLRCERSPHEVAMLFYTSGTTAEPKGVMHTASTFGAYTRSGVETMGTGPDDVGLLQFPLTHIGGLSAFVAAPLLAGSRVVYLDAWQPAAALDLIEREKVTSAGGPPVILQGLMADPSFSSDRVRSLRTAGTGAAGIPPELVQQVGERLGVSCFRAYGLTECPMLTTGLRSDAEEQRMHTDGRPSPGCDVRIVDSEQREVGPGVEGEIEAFGPQLCVGYLDPELDTAAFTADGYLRTGDLGVVDANGYVRVTGRLKDIIIRKGENLSAQAIEEILFGHPDIADVAVVGLPDPSCGERACAVVVLRDGCGKPQPGRAKRLYDRATDDASDDSGADRGRRRLAAQRDGQGAQVRVAKRALVARSPISRGIERFTSLGGSETGTRKRSGLG